MGERRAAHCALALIGALLASAAAAEKPGGEAPRRYRLEAADGIPGAVYVGLKVDAPGAYRVTATFAGRKVAGLWIENAAGLTLRRMVGASPLTVEVTVGGREVPLGDKLRVRFAPTTDRGPLTGELVISSPVPSAGQTASRAAAPAPAAPLTGAGAVLVPAFADDPAGRALRRLADVLENSKPPAVEWSRRWAGALAQAAGAPQDAAACRSALDRLWSDLAGDPAPGEAAGSAFRGVLASVEDLARRESRLKDAEKAKLLRTRRADVAAALGHLAATQP